MHNSQRQTLKLALHELLGNGHIGRAVEFLDSHKSEFLVQTLETVLAEISAYSDANNPQIRLELQNHLAAHSAELLRLLRGGALGEFEFVRLHARRRAEQRFPLEAMLHAYKCAQRVFASWLREAIFPGVPADENSPKIVADVADFASGYTDAISTIATSAYVSQVRIHTEVAGVERAELLTMLLEGYDESNEHVVKLLRKDGYLDRRRSFCVALARPVDPAEMKNPHRARRLAQAISDSLRQISVQHIADVRGIGVVIIISKLRRLSGWSAADSALGEHVAQQLMTLGNSVLIGISSDVTAAIQMPQAYNGARVALSLADVGNRLVRLADVPLMHLLTYLAGDQIRQFLPSWASSFSTADAASRGRLVATLRAYASADMNAIRAARALGIHPNTLYARLQRICDVSGVDARSYDGLTELLIACDCTIQNDLEQQR